MSTFLIETKDSLGNLTERQIRHRHETNTLNVDKNTLKLNQERLANYEVELMEIKSNKNVELESKNAKLKELNGTIELKRQAFNKIIQNITDLHKNRVKNGTELSHDIRDAELVLPRERTAMIKAELEYIEEYYSELLGISDEIIASEVAQMKSDELENLIEKQRIENEEKRLADEKAEIRKEQRRIMILVIAKVNEAEAQSLKSVEEHFDFHLWLYETYLKK